VKYSAIGPDGKKIRGQFVEYFNDNRPTHIVDACTVIISEKSDSRNTKMLQDWMQKNKK
jgi:hypothetical protein